VGSFLHPVGSLPPSAYWFRRAVVLVVVLLLVVGGWLLLSGVAGGKKGAGPSASTTPHVSASQTPVTTPSPTPDPTPSVSHTATGTPSPPAVTACHDADIKVTALTDASSYAAGAKPHLTVSITNTGKVACKRDIGRAAMTLLVMSGTTRVWSSDDCNPGGQPAVNTLKPGQVFSSTVIWTRTTSKVGCPSGQPAAAAGTYTLTSRNGKITSAPVTFVLH
jgi:hypothetical protein